MMHEHAKYVACSHPVVDLPPPHPRQTQKTATRPTLRDIHRKRPLISSFFSFYPTNERENS